MSRSTMRLNPIAAKRAAVNATTTHPMSGHVTGASYDAITTPTSANGSANTVCGSLTKFAHFTKNGRGRLRANARAASFAIVISASSPTTPRAHSTHAFVASSISISFGQLRVNPSSGHFRVASIPILEPYVNARLE